MQVIPNTHDVAGETFGDLHRFESERAGLTRSLELRRYTTGTEGTVVGVVASVSPHSTSCADVILFLTPAQARDIAVHLLLVAHEAEEHEARTVVEGA